jgi:hypothetical protein
MRKVPDFKIEKTVVNATARKLNVTYTIEEPEIISTFGAEVLDDLQFALQRGIYGPSLIDQGWKEVYVGGKWRELTDEWCKQNLKGQYSCMGAYWFFEKEEDAAWVILKWK